jgi:serine/threonine protein kinase
MTTSRAQWPDPQAISPDAADALATALVEEMTQSWRQGNRVLAEDILSRFPALWEHPEAAAELIYEEISLRWEHGAEAPMEEILGRFAQWRSQLEVLFDCHRVLAPWPAPRFPAAGDFVDEFELVTELGRGKLGRVFLAKQSTLAGRPVVLKFTPWDVSEHLALARLQHSHIVPLYSVQDHPDRGLRSLCMPYYGGAVLSGVLEELRSIAPADRTALDLRDALERASGIADSIATPFRGKSGRGTALASYVQSVCWIGACLADALQYAHERGLVHLDFKPSNVLLAANGQPMLLDFHLAREPVNPGGQGPNWFGGTPGYMSPEQRDALRALRENQPIERPVDERSDLYSLAVVLYEALSGRPPNDGEIARSLRCHNLSVSAGLSNVVERCLAEDPAARYHDAQSLATELQRFA